MKSRSRSDPIRVSHRFVCDVIVLGRSRSLTERSIGSPVRVLLVEDAKTDARFVQHGLQTYSNRSEDVSFQISTAASLCEARAMIAETVFDIAILDFCLPDGNGLQLVKDCRSRNELCAVILLTGKEESETAINGLRLGIDDYLSKRDLSLHILTRTVLYAMERKKNERMKLASQADYEQRNHLEAIGRLAAGVAHDLNTPLQAILTNISFARTRASSILAALQGIPEVSRGTMCEQELLLESLADAQASLQQASYSVASLYELSHSSESLDEKVDLLDVLRKALELAERRFRHRVQIDRAFDDTLIWMVRSTPHALIRVIANLLDNAVDSIEAAPNNSHCNGRRIRISVCCSEDCLMVAIEDSGMGVPEDIRDKVFQPFFTTKPVGQGTGQGLAVAKSVMISLGGDIALEESALGGVSMVLSFPKLKTGIERELRC